MPKISELAEVAGLTDGDFIPVVDGETGETKRLDAANLIGDPLVLPGDLIFPAVGARGTLMGDKNASDWGWKDLIGDVSPKGLGANTPTRNAFRGNVHALSFGVNDLADLTFHMPHDWVPGTDLFIHVHWGHNGTSISGTFTVELYATFARGFNQGSDGDFVAPVTATVSVPNLAIGTTPQYRHRTDEVQLTAASPNANQLDTDALETDGLLLVGLKVTSIPTIGGGTNEPFIFTVDLHYQSRDGAGSTPNKAPSFYD